MRRLLRRAIPALLGLSSSLALHLGVLVVLREAVRLPDPGLSVVMPNEVEFGLTEGTKATRLPSASHEADSDPPQSPAPIANETSAPGSDAGVPNDGAAAGHDAGPRRPRTRDGGATPDAARRPALGDDAEFEMPAGAMIAFRVDMARVRRSPFAPQVRALLAAIPDVRAILGASGLDPVEELDRLVVTSPDFRSRDRIVIAGRHRAGREQIAEALTRMSAATGAPSPTWRRQGDLELTTWPDADETERVLVLVGPAEFVIAPTSMLEPYLAVAVASSRRGPRGAPSLAASLLSLKEEETLALEVEGARHFVRMDRDAAEQVIPRRVRVGAVERGEAVRVEALGEYESEDKARAAAEWFSRVAETYSQSLLVRLMGLSSALDSLELEVHDATVHATTQLERRQAELLLAKIGSRLAPRPPPVDGARAPAGEHATGASSPE